MLGLCLNLKWGRLSSAAEQVFEFISNRAKQNIQQMIFKIFKTYVDSSVNKDETSKPRQVAFVCTNL